MDFLKNNVFYVILIAGVLLVSIPSFMAASRKMETYQKNLKEASNRVKTAETMVKKLKPVSEEAIKEAQRYQQDWQQNKQRIFDLVGEANRHLDMDFLVAPEQEGDTPDGDLYKQAYSAGYDALNQRLIKAGLMDPRNSALPSKANFKDRTPSGSDIRISQKQYWIVRELVDLFTDPESGVKSVTSVKLDFVPNAQGALNKPDGRNTFWIYPMSLEFQIDFRDFRVFFQKLLDDKNVLFMPGNYLIERAFDSSKPVYVPLVQVSLYCEVWDYVSTPFEQENLAAYKPKAGGGAGGAGAAGGGRRRPAGGK